VKFLTVFALFVCVSVSATFGQTSTSFYVSTNGDDSNPGTEAAPWRTIQHAADNARAGSTVNIRGGVYEELVNISASGNSSDGFITFRSYPGETAILDATRFTPTARSGIVTIHDQSYVRVQGLEIRNFRTSEHRLTPLGISVTVTRLPRRLVRELDLLSETAVEVMEAVPNGPAAVAGIRSHDIIVAANDRIVGSVDDLHRLLSGRLAGTSGAKNAFAIPEGTHGEMELSVIRDERITRITVTPRLAGQ